MRNDRVHTAEVEAYSRRAGEPMTVIARAREVVAKIGGRRLKILKATKERPTDSGAADQSEICRALANAAASAYSTGDRVASFALRGSAHAITSTTRDLIHMLEAARLAGFLPFYEHALASLSVRLITETLTPEYASELIVERDRIARCSFDECEYLMRTLPRVPRQIRAQLLQHGLLNEPAFAQEISAPLPSMWEAADAADTIVLDAAEICSVPEIAVVSTVGRTSLRAEVRAGGMLKISNATAFVSSDLVLANGTFFADYYTYADSFNNSPNNDSVIADVRTREQKICVVLSKDAPVLAVSQLAWLAYPTSWAWGHWVPEVLTRYAYMLDAGLDRKTPVIVDARVPQKYRDFLRLMNSEVQIIEAPAGTKVVCRQLWMSPSRLYAAHNPRWSLDEIDRRVYAEPKGFRRFCNRVPQEPESKFVPQLPKRVFVSRHLGQHKRDLEDDERFRREAESLGFVSVDPGELSATDQVGLFRQAESLCGLDGAGWFLAPLAREGTRSVIVGGDLCRASRGWSWVIEEMTGRAPEWVLGQRKVPIPGFGGEIFQQDFKLDEPSWATLVSTLRSSVNLD